MLKPIEELIPYARNARKHSPEQVAQIAASIREFGFKVPIILDGEGTIRAGHGRVLAARKLKLKEVPCLQYDDLTETQWRAFVLADNQIALNASWDEEIKKVEIDDLRRLDFDVKVIGFDDKELAASEGAAAGNRDDDAVPEIDEKAPAIVQRGEIWQLGNHRLMCGDSTSEADVARLMAGEKADMVFTDPPYGVNYEGGHFHSGDVNIKRKREKLAHDDDASIYTRVVPVICKFVDGPCYTWYAASKATPLYQSIDEHGEFHAMIVWHKTNAKYAALNAQYKQRHEPCAYWKPKGSTLRWCGPTDECTIWEEKRDASNEYHPTQKPVCLAERAIGNHEVSSVLDLFLGSGSTLIACEKTGRRCYGMEISPHYCDVIIKRWEDYTGRKAVRQS